ncbi:MAG: flavocytochrome c [Sutterellaceae bacterium]|nr:flavocytochrome c [Sutterellaceae bacterium]MDD7442705.1 flavocytochrome c [Sutterellaceae bacterium]MDY2868507.1 flavocytochrome c [Mesosutterella sp.]
MAVEISRRRVLAAAAAGAALVPVARTASATPSDPVPAKWDEEVDVLIVGSGFAGLAAAYEAKKAGASVLVIEKMRTPGGNSIINGGIMSAPGCPGQIAEGIKDSPALLAADMLREGQGYNNPEKVKFLAEHALDTYWWCEKELGVRWVKDKIGQEGGHSVPRHAYTINGSGSEIVNAELRTLEKMGVKPRLRCFMERIVRDSDGRVKGLVVREGYRFGKPDSGKRKAILARRAVVLCHGGFGADVTYRMHQDPKLTAKFDTTNQPGATSEAWRESSRVGCQIIQADWIQCGPWNSPVEKGMGIALYFAQGGAASFGVWLDTKTGKRFVNELANRKVRADAIINRNNAGHTCIALTDSLGVEHLRSSRKGILEKCLERGCVKKYETLEDVAKAHSIPMEALKKTIADHNEDLAAGKDREFGRYINKLCKPMGTGPWYVSILSPKVHHCMGGILTDNDAQALDISTDKPIPGLFAAGEATGGVHGAVRLGSCATLDCLVNGRVAGRRAAAEKPWA